MALKNMKRMQENLTGSMEYPSSQMCICEYCGFKIVANDGNCSTQTCARCGAMMRDHSGMRSDATKVVPGPGWSPTPIPDEDH